MTEFNWYCIAFYFWINVSLNYDCAEEETPANGRGRRGGRRAAVPAVPEPETDVKPAETKKKTPAKGRGKPRGRAAVSAVDPEPETEVEPAETEVEPAETEVEPAETEVEPTETKQKAAAKGRGKPRGRAAVPAVDPESETELEPAETQKKVPAKGRGRPRGPVSAVDPESETEVAEPAETKKKAAAKGRGKARGRAAAGKEAESEAAESIPSPEAVATRTSKRAIAQKTEPAAKKSRKESVTVDEDSGDKLAIRKVSVRIQRSSVIDEIAIASEAECSSPPSKKKAAAPRTTRKKVSFTAEPEPVATSPRRTRRARN